MLGIPAVRIQFRQILAAGLLILLLSAIAGVHIHAATARSQDGACLACALSNTHEGVNGSAIVPAPDSTLDVSPTAEAPAARPSLPDLTGRSPPFLLAA